MAGIILTPKSTAATPASGKGVVYVDASAKLLRVINDAGFRRTLGLNTYSTAAEIYTTGNQIVGSVIGFPAGSLQIGSCFRWTFNMTKTAAGTASSTFNIVSSRLAANVVSFTKPAGTAVVDEATIVITAICRGPLSASGVVAGQFSMTHNLAATGHATVPSVNVTTISSGFDVTQETGFSINSLLGLNDVVTFQDVTVETWNL